MVFPLLTMFENRMYGISPLKIKSNVNGVGLVSIMFSLCENCVAF